MLETLSISRDLEGKNPMSADNQQERLLTHEQKRWFLAGFIEGEGSWCVSIKEHPTAKYGYYVDPEFFLYQHESRRGLLEMAGEVFGTGRIFPKPQNEKVLVYRIGARRSLIERVIPFCDRYMRFSKRGQDYRIWKEIVMALENKEHRSAEGMVRLVKLAYKMNPLSKGKKRKHSLDLVVSRILRDCTPDTRESEETVRTA